MLSDLERKILRILCNFEAIHRRMPDQYELERVTGRECADIERGLNELVQQQYIFWPDRPNLQTIVILEGRERDLPSKPKPRPPGNTDYWTKY